MESTTTNGQQLIVGLNPGKGRIIFGRLALFTAFGVPILSTFQPFVPWFLFWISLPTAIIATCGQQYRLDATTDEFSKRRLYFFRTSSWVVLNQASSIANIRRYKQTGDDGGEPLNSNIDFNFKDGTTHTWSMMYGPSSDYALEINTFLKSFEKAKNLTEYQAPVSHVGSESLPVTSSTAQPTVWEQPAPEASLPTPVTPSASANVWDTAPAADQGQNPAGSVWDQ
jgi:hypothetical protein